MGSGFLLWANLLKAHIGGRVYICRLYTEYSVLLPPRIYSQSPPLQPSKIAAFCNFGTKHRKISWRGKNTIMKVTSGVFLFSRIINPQIHLTLVVFQSFQLVVLHTWPNFVIWFQMESFYETNWIRKFVAVLSISNFFFQSCYVAFYGFLTDFNMCNNL